MRSIAILISIFILHPTYAAPRDSAERSARSRVATHGSSGGGIANPLKKHSQNRDLKEGEEIGLNGKLVWKDDFLYLKGESGTLYKLDSRMAPDLEGRLISLSENHKSGLELSLDGVLKDGTLFVKSIEDDKTQQFKSRYSVYVHGKKAKDIGKKLAKMPRLSVEFAGEGEMTVKTDLSLRSLGKLLKTELGKDFRGVFYYGDGGF